MEAKLFFESQMNKPAEALRIGKRSVAVYSSRCPGKETPNEDAAAVLPWGESAAVLVVADGLGGASMGEVAARTAVEALAGAIRKADPADGQLRTAILDGIETANQAVLGIGAGAATTLAVVELLVDDGGGETVRAYHVGDSGVLICGGRGKVKLLTTAHSPVGYGVEAGLLDAEDAMHHEDRHVVSNVVGAADSRIEIGPAIRLAPLDRILLASDGLFDNLSTDEITAILSRGGAMKAARRLAEEAGGRMAEESDSTPSKPDDLTLVVVR